MYAGVPTSVPVRVRPAAPCACVSGAASVEVRRCPAVAGLRAGRAARPKSMTRTLAVRSDHDVLWLEVAVDEARRVRRRRARGRRRGTPPELRARRGARGLSHAASVCAVDELHRDEHAIVDRARRRGPRRRSGARASRSPWPRAAGAAARLGHRRLARLGAAASARPCDPARGRRPRRPRPCRRGRPVRGRRSGPRARRAAGGRRGAPAASATDACVTPTRASGEPWASTAGAAAATKSRHAAQGRDGRRRRRPRRRRGVLPGTRPESSRRGRERSSTRAQAAMVRRVRKSGWRSAGRRDWTVRAETAEPLVTPGSRKTTMKTIQTKQRAQGQGEREGGRPDLNHNRGGCASRPPQGRRPREHEPQSRRPLRKAGLKAGGSCRSTTVAAVGDSHCVARDRRATVGVRGAWWRRSRPRLGAEAGAPVG